MSGFGTLGFLGLMRSIQTQANPFSLPRLCTENAKWSAPSLVPGSDNAMRLTSDWPATAIRSRHIEDIIPEKAWGCGPS